MCDQNAPAVQNDLNEVHVQNERDATNDQTDHRALIMQTEQIALKDLLDRKIPTDRHDHLAQKDPFVLTIQIVLLVPKAQIVLFVRKVRIVLAGLIEEKDRLARIEPRGHHVPRVRIEPRGHHVPTDRTETIDQPVLTGQLARKVATGQPHATGLLVRIERVLLVESAESGTGIPNDDQDHPVPLWQKSHQVLAREFMTTMSSNLLTIPQRYMMTLT